MITLTREEAEKMLHYMDEGGTYTDDYGKLIETLRARLSAPEPEPVACPKEPANIEELYTAPPQREWQSLTDEEVNKIMWPSPATAYDLARAIEAKLREKNSD